MGFKYLRKYYKNGKAVYVYANKNTHRQINAASDAIGDSYDKYYQNRRENDRAFDRLFDLKRAGAGRSNAANLEREKLDKTRAAEEVNASINRTATERYNELVRKNSLKAQATRAASNIGRRYVDTLKKKKKK